MEKLDKDNLWDNRSNMTQSTTFLYSKKTTKIFDAMNKQIWASPQTEIIYLKPEDYDALVSTTHEHVRNKNPDHLFYKGCRVEAAPE